MTLGIVDSGACNLRAYVNIAETLKLDYTIVTNPDGVSECSKLVLPGVGSFGGVASGMAETGLDEAIKTAVGRGVPLLGICAGMQILFQESEESPGVIGLGLVEGAVKRLPVVARAKINIGWSHVPGLEGSFYFVHSFYCKSSKSLEVEYKASFGEHEFLAGFRSENILGVQFHPEKSGKVGLQLLSRLIDEM
jgi:imidazole glycerol-phosphate synthase subunit HisH